MIKHKLILETIAAIEQSFDVNTVRYKDILVWPLVRIKIYQQMWHTETNYRSISYGCHVNYPVFTIQEQKINELKKYNNAEILFFSRLEEHETIKGKLYNPYIDTMIDLAKVENYNYVKIEMHSKQSQYSKLRFEPTILLQPIVLRYEEDMISSIENFAELQMVIQDISGIQFEERMFLEEARLINQIQNFFIEVLSIIHPKTVFLVCYYYTTAMALVKACKKLGISTVDIQHGTYGNYHGAYTHWTTIPSEGYNLVPDYYWCWGKTSKESIEKWYSRIFHHQPIVGSNLNIAKSIEEIDFKVDKGFIEFYDQLRHNKDKDKVVLIAMSYPDIPNIVFETIRLAPNEWIWMIRLHPRYRTIKDINRIIDIFKEQGINNYEIEYANNCSLHELLKNCDHIVISLSSIFYEALAFRVPTTMIDQSGLEYYEDDIKKGILTYADTSDRLLASIKQGFSHNVKPSDYIETDKQCAKNAMQIIMRNTSQGICQNINYSFGNKTAKQNDVYSNNMNKLGTELARRNLIKAAFNCFFKAIETNKLFALGYNNIGILYCHSEENNKALQYLVKALEIKPDDQRIVSNVIEFLKILGNIQTHRNMLLLF